MGVKRRLRHCCFLAVASTATAQSVGASESRVHDRNALTVSFQAEPVKSERQFPLNEPCTAMIRDIMSSGAGRMDLQCSTPSGMTYSVPHVDAAWVEEKQRNQQLISGYTELDLPPNTMVDSATNMLILDSPPRLRDPSIDTDLTRRRRLTTAEKASGSKTVLVVRVDAADSSTSLSENQVASDIFGDNGDPNNLRSQYLACSYGKFVLDKAADKSGGDMNISNGVVSVSLPNMSSSAGDTAMLNAINRELADQFGTPAFKLADFVIYCMPPGAMHPLDVAYAFMDGYRSIYNDVACSQVSTQLHEFGHNLNLAHSGMGNDEYGDKSGMMGYSYEEDDLPYMCFNAAKSWQLGWYADKALRLAPTPTGQFQFEVELVGVADYGTTEHAVVIKIEQEFSNWAYFLNYNAGKGINEGTQYGKDRVLVTMKDTAEEANTSKLVAQLRVGQNLRIRNFNGRADEEFVVRWAARTNDVASLQMTLRGPDVPDPTQSPTIPPSVGPSFTPSNTPSVATSAPTIPPSIGPSFAPSLVPSAKPKVPTILPSISPSFKPSLVPSAGPSSIPTPLFSEMPSLSLQPTLSIVPSGAPTTSESPSSTGVPSNSPSLSFVPSEASQEPSLTPSNSQSPSSEPSIMPSGLPSLFPTLTNHPSNVPSQLPSFAPSTMPSFASAEFESSFALQLRSGTEFEVFLKVCDALRSYLDGVTKSTYGNETSTNVSCLPVVEAAIVSQNVFDRGADVTVVTASYFPIAAIGPNATEYESHIREAIASDDGGGVLPDIIGETIDEAGLERGAIVKMQWDDETFDTPVLKVVFEDETPQSSAVHACIHLSCILSFLYLLFNL